MEIDRPPTSALIKRLRDASRVKPRSMGFGRREDEKPEPAMVLIAEVAGLDAVAARTAAAAGAAAIAFMVGGDEALAIAGGEVGALGEAVAACGDAIPGLIFDGQTAAPADLAARVESSGLDFAISGVERAPAALLGHETLALVARIDNYGERPAFLRALGDLRVDAVVAGRALPGAAHSALTVFDLMAYKLVVESVRQPVLVLAEDSVRPDDLQALRDVGVDGLVVAAGADAGASLASYREAIAKVKITRRAAPSGDGGALLPRPSAPSGASSDDDDDDD